MPDFQGSVNGLLTSMLGWLNDFFYNVFAWLEAFFSGGV